MGQDVGQFIGDYVFQIGVALVALTAASAWIISRRRRYVKSVEFKRGIEAVRLELRRSIDEALMASARKASARSDKLLSVIEPLDASVTDLNVRLARLEEHADSIEAFMTGPHNNVLQEAEQTATRLRKLEQRLIALTDLVSVIEQTIDAASRKDQERNDSIEVRLTSTEKRIANLIPRLELEEKAREDLGGLVGLFVKQLKRVNMTSAETAVRVAELDKLRLKIAALEERHGSKLDHQRHASAEHITTNDPAEIGPASPNPVDETRVIETSNGSAKGEPVSTEEPPNQPIFDVSNLSENSSAIGANGHA